MKLCYIKWKDALSTEAGDAIAQLATLEEIGWLLHETPEAVLISMEAPGELPSRWRLNIPRGQILEMQVFSRPKPRKKILIPSLETP